MNLTKTQLFTIVGAIALLITLAFTNPFSYNDATTRTVVTQMSGKQFCMFQPGPFYAGFFASETTYPNQLGVLYEGSEADMAMDDNAVDIGTTQIQFSGGTTAYVKGIVQYVLPSDEKSMIEIHNTHKSVEGLVRRRLAPYTKECLGNSAQLLTAEAHYSGGKAQMTQNYLDQLKSGSYLLKLNEVNTFDSSEHITKKVYVTEIQRDKNNLPLRKFSSIKEYGILVGDAQITDTDYESKVDSMLAKQIESATAASVSKQALMTAQQQALTAEAQGKKRLVEIEYEQKQEQTKAVVSAQTAVELAKQDKEKQKIASEAAELEAKKVKTLADAEAYAKQRVMAADGALDKKLEAYVTVQQFWAEAFKGYTGAVVPQYVTGSTGSAHNGATSFMDIMTANAMKDLNLKLTNK